VLVDGLGLGLELRDGLGLGLVLAVGLVVGLVVGVVVGELLVAVGFGLGDEVVLLLGLGLAGVLVVLVADAVGFAGELPVGGALAEDEGLPVGVALADPEEEDFPVGLALADPEEEEELPDGLALAEALPEPLGELLARLTTESSRIAFFGRLEQAPLTIGGPPALLAMDAPKTSELDARSMKPVSAPSATGLTRRALIGAAPSWTSLPECSCPPWSSQYACPD
jgi:hypothetical protein